uniref:Uncharacterized protein n=1 Tax=Erpetoichthys calabaricus TaxID=27687 RepID=A0A8C4RWL9_ERPCA
VIKCHARKVKPLDGALIVVTTDHLPVRHLVAQTVSGLVGVDGQVCRRGLPLRLRFRTLLFLGGFGFFLLGRASCDLLTVVVIIGCVFPVLVVPLSSRSLIAGLLTGVAVLVSTFLLTGFTGSTI